MNKKDIILIISILIISISTIIYYNSNDDIANKTIVYHGKDVILNIDLNINKIYQVDGDNGIVKLEVNNKRIRVLEETSNYHLCSKQGYISKPNESIICLPNKIIIEIPSDEIDTQVK